MTSKFFFLAKICAHTRAVNLCMHILLLTHWLYLLTSKVKLKIDCNLVRSMQATNFVLYSNLIRTFVRCLFIRLCVCTQFSIWTSPPYARVAAMRSMQQQNQKTSKHAWNIFKTLFEIFLKHTWHFLEHPRIFLKTSLNLPWITLWTSFRSLEAPWNNP